MKREMRCATHGNYPKIAIFENVPGVLNSDRGRSYKTIIEAFTESEVPMPESGRWANAGMARGGSVDFAWVVKDAQHYRVAQRRKRLLAVADFTGQRSGEILFKSKSLSGYFEARKFARQGTPAYAESGAGGEGGGSIGVFMAGQTKNARSIAYNGTVAPTLRGAPSGLNQVPCVCESLQGFRKISGTLASKGTGGHSLHDQNPIRTGYVIRRLTPTECERLMAFPDGYTATGHDGKVMSDSARYQMLGNSIVVNVLAYIMQNVAERLGGTPQWIKNL
jgi:DNA (cytosine-5)-methyltransferase 1